jgi:hypothetical protein
MSHHNSFWDSHWATLERHEKEANAARGRQQNLMVDEEVMSATRGKHYHILPALGDTSMRRQNVVIDEQCLFDNPHHAMYLLREVVRMSKRTGGPITLHVRHISDYSDDYTTLDKAMDKASPRVTRASDMVGTTTASTGVTASPNDPGMGHLARALAAARGIPRQSGGPGPAIPQPPDPFFDEKGYVYGYGLGGKENAPAIPLAPTACTCKVNDKTCQVPTGVYHDCICGARASGCQERPGHSDYCRYKKESKS